MTLKLRGAAQTLTSLRLLGHLLLQSCDAAVDEALSRTACVPDALRDEIKKTQRC